MRDGALTREQEFEQLIFRLDLGAIKEALSVLENESLLSRIQRLISPNKETEQSIAFKQLDFLEIVISQFDKETPEEKAYILLGALEFVQQRWGKFPSYGPLLDLVLKEDDLVQCIAENAEGIQLKNLMNNPNLIYEEGENQFIAFMSRHRIVQDLVDFE